MNKIGKSPFESNPPPGLVGPPAIQRRRDRTGEIIDEPDLVRTPPPGSVGAQLAQQCIGGRYRDVAGDFIDELLAEGVDPVTEIEILYAAARSIARRAAR